MGVPAFFKWICMRCPKILHDVIEDDLKDQIEDVELLNQGDLDIDNLYLDMNGIIHPCTHPEHLPIPQPLTEEDMFNNIYKYLDKVIGMVKPKKLIYFAVDGVAPRAKMNQQRGRRFKAAQEALATMQKKEELKKAWQERGEVYPDELEKDFNNKFDSNVITPGTEFMDRMSKAVQYYITERMNNHPRFKDLKCILSDANIPGEGEHKMLHFIRQQRALEGYDPNTRHCLYGADADLIMLGLSTHEPYFYILRETVMTKNEMKEMSGNNEPKQMEGEFHEKAKKEIPIHFQFVKLHAFREYLDYEFKYLETPFQYDLEKVIDDFVFMCFFVGNDFLPHLPCLTIREGGIDCLMYLYKRILPFMGGNFVENGTLNLMRVDILMREIGQIEQALLKAAQKSEEMRKNRGGGRGGRGGRGRGDQRGPRINADNRLDRSNTYERLDGQDRNRDRDYDRDRNRDNRDRDYDRDRSSNRDRDYDRDRNRDYDRDRSSNRDRDGYNRNDRSRDDRYNNRDDRYNRSDSYNRNRDESNRNGGGEDKAERNQKNRSAADALRDQISGSAEDKHQNNEPDLSKQQREGAESTADKTKDASSSLADWSRDVEDDEEAKKEAATEAEKEDLPIIPAEEVIKTIQEAEQKLAKLDTDITDGAEEEKPKEESKMQEEKKPRDKFNDELKEKMKEFQTVQEPEDDVPSGPFNFKQNYYFEKFKVMPHEIPEFRKLIQKAYCEALCWIFAYYYKGCVSWSWYYPFNYTPFASDMYGMDKVSVQFELGAPFQPVAQLLAVLPPYSSKAVPACLRHLMLEDDSEIIDFYPKDFVVDVKGKRFAWMGEVILPFIDEDRLLTAIAKYVDKLSPAETKRNILGDDLLFVRNEGAVVTSLKETTPEVDFVSVGSKTYLDYPKARIGGFFKGKSQKYQLDKFYSKPFPSEAVTEISSNQVVALVYENPEYKPHISVILEGSIAPEQYMSDAIFEQVDRRMYGGSRTIRLIERTLGIQADAGHRYNQGTLNSGNEGVRTSYGINHQQAHLYNFNADFNNNRAVASMPSQFKRHNYQPQQQHYQQYPPQQQHQQYPQQQQYPPQQQYQRQYPDNNYSRGNQPPPNKPMNPMGGNFPFNPPPYNQQQQQQYGGGHQNRFAPLNQNLNQGQQNPFDLLGKRDRPNTSRSPDEQYGDETRKQHHRQ